MSSTVNSIDLILKNDFSTTSFAKSRQEEILHEADDKKSFILDFEEKQISNDSAPVKLRIGNQFESVNFMHGFQEVSCH